MTTHSLRRRLAAVTTVFLLFGDASAASAQSGEPPTLQPSDPNVPQGEKPTLPNTGESLSDQLNRSGGVIRPPEQTTPEMRISPPHDPGAGSTPVIPPPGTPGGKPAPVPK